MSDLFGKILGTKPKEIKEVLDDWQVLIKEEMRRGASGSLESNIRARCIYCSYDPLGGSMIKQIHNCGVVHCPLYPYRARSSTEPAAPAPKLVEIKTCNSKEIQRKDSLIRERQLRNTTRDAIDANCIDCIYDAHEPGTWREQVQACEDYECPLHPVRATSHADNK